MKRVLLVLTGIIISACAFSQPGEGADRRGGGQQKGRLYGKIVDAKTNKGIEAASVQLSEQPIIHLRAAC